MAVVVWYLSLILSHFIILSESHTSPESYFPHRCPGKKFTIIWSLLTFRCSIYGSMDQMIISCYWLHLRILLCQFTQFSVGFMRSLVLLHWHQWLPMGSMMAKWTASDAVIVNSKNASESCQQNACLQYDAIDLFLLWNASGELFGGPMCWENLHMCTVLLASRLEQRDEGWEVKLGTAGLIGWISTTLREECPNMKIIDST